MSDPASKLTVWHRLERLLARWRPRREPISLLIDAAIVMACWHLTYVFRLGFERWGTSRPGYDHWVLVGATAAYVAALVVFRVPRSMWRFSGFGEIQRLAVACLSAGLVVAWVVTLLGLSKVPRAVLALHPVFALMGMAVARMVYRAIYEHARARITGGDRGEVRRAIVLGAGEAARRLVAGIHQQGWIVLGLLDDDPSKRNARIGGVPVLGTLDRLRDPAVMAEATHIIVALPSVHGARRREIFDWAAQLRRPVLTVPSAAQLQNGLHVSRVRDIEAQDLLGREPIRMDETGIGDVLQGRVVLVTGAGGSIGAELCRQIMRFAPARLVLVELSEFNLYTIEQELAKRHPTVALHRLIADVRNPEQMMAIFLAQRPSVVFHAAAFKHVPLMEEDANAWQCLRNNTLGTFLAARAAAECGVERFVLISTDKAVNPTSVMGASKRAAEMVLSALTPLHRNTRFVTVRFGNVLGSSGSVIPKFKEQIEQGGPVTVTHPDVIRYFMTISEAVRLVLQAAAIGASGQVLVLDMGEPVKILDLARQLIRLAGHAPDDIAIEFSGLRPGEKLYEELLADTDAIVPTQVERLAVARLDEDPGSLRNLMGSMNLLADNVAGNARAWLGSVVPEFKQHQGQASATIARDADGPGCVVDQERHPGHKA